MSQRGIAAARDLARAALAILEDPSTFTQQNTAALWISQRTVEATIGVGPRLFLEDVSNPTYTPEVIKRGKLRLTRTEDYLDYLRTRSVARPAESDGVECVLAECGIRLVSGGKR